MESRLVDDRSDPRKRLSALARYWVSEKRHRAAVGFRETEQRADERRLARAVRPQITERGPTWNEQFDIVDGDGVTESLRQTVRLDGPAISVVRRS